MGLYYDELRVAMAMLAAKPEAVFLGQAVADAGTAMRGTLVDVPVAQLLEMPVAEDMQLGMATGMALAGILPICCYPRINFLLLATNQLILHLDKLPLYSGYRPKVIIRTAVATDSPLDPGPQHLGDFTVPLRQMLRTVEVVDLLSAADVAREYRKAAERDGSTLLVERAELY